MTAGQATCIQIIEDGLLEALIETGREQLVEFEKYQAGLIEQQARGDDGILGSFVEADEFPSQIPYVDLEKTK